MWWKKKKCEHEFVPKTEAKPEVLPDVCLEVTDAIGSKREIYCRTSSVSTSGILTLCDANGLIAAQYAAGFWKSAIVLEPKKPAPQAEQAVATQAADAEVVEKAGEVAVSGPGGNSRA